MTEPEEHKDILQRLDERPFEAWRRDRKRLEDARDVADARRAAAETKLATLTEAVSDASVLKTHADGSVTLHLPAAAARAAYAAIGVEDQS